MNDASEVGSDEWSESAMLVHNSTALLTKDHRCVVEALRLLNKDPSVQVNMARLLTFNKLNLVPQNIDTLLAFIERYCLQMSLVFLLNSDILLPSCRKWLWRCQLTRLYRKL